MTESGLDNSFGVHLLGRSVPEMIVGSSKDIYQYQSLLVGDTRRVAKRREHDTNISYTRLKIPNVCVGVKGIVNQSVGTTEMRGSKFLIIVPSRRYSDHSFGCSFLLTEV